MGQFGGYYKGERKKLKKEQLEKKAKQIANRKPFILPKVELVKKNKNW